MRLRQAGQSTSTFFLLSWLHLLKVVRNCKYIAMCELIQNLAISFLCFKFVTMPTFAFQFSPHTHTHKMKLHEKTTWHTWIRMFKSRRAVLCNLSCFLSLIICSCLVGIYRLSGCHVLAWRLTKPNLKCSQKSWMPFELGWSREGASSFMSVTKISFAMHVHTPEAARLKTWIQVWEHMLPE